MKILQINSLFTPRRFGGAEVFLERLAAELVDRGHNVSVACLSPAPVPSESGPIRVHELPLRNMYWPFDGRPQSALRKAIWHVRNSYGGGSAADIGNLIAHERPDLIHTHNLAGLTTTVWQATHARGVPIVHTIHDYALLCTSHTMFRRQRNCAAQCFGCRAISYPKRAHSQAVNTVIGVSGFVLERHLEYGYFAQARALVIPNGAPCDTAAGAPTARIPGERLRVGYLGRLAPSKGIEMMLESLAPLASHQCEVFVAGSGDAPYVAELRRRFAGPAVQFMGQVRAETFLPSVDVLVVPSLWHEPFGLVLCEAIRAGVPVVASAVGGIPEVIQHGQCGLLFDPGDGAALRKHVRDLTLQPLRRNALSDQCHARASEYDFNRTVDLYLSAYEQTLN